MNILYLCEEYPPGKNGGIGTMVQVLGRALVKQGHQVFVIGLYPHGYMQQDYEEDEGVKIWRLRYKTDIGLVKNNHSATSTLFRKFLKYTTLLHWDTKFSAKALFIFIKKLIDRYDIDIIEMPDWNTFLHNSLNTITIPAFRIPLIVKLHGSYSYLLNEMDKPLNKRIFIAEKKLLNRADAISSVSLYSSVNSKKLFSLDKEITVLYNGIDMLPENNLHQAGDKVIFSGTLVRKKGIYSLIKAWHIVNRQVPSLTLHLYGKGVVNDLKNIIDKNVLSSVIFHGHVTREVLLKELASATVAVFPSYSECFSMAPLEAMAAGCAVVYTSRSSGPELITHKENGLLADPDDITAIADAILLLIKDKNYRTSIATAGKALVSEKFNITNIAKQHINFYTETINGSVIK
jgi:glycosyltransferase involved in cell wall biosynthesis